MPDLVIPFAVSSYLHNEKLWDFKQHLCVRSHFTMEMNKSLTIFISHIDQFEDY